MTFGAHKLVHSESFLDYLYEVWQLLSVLCSIMRKKFILVHIYILGPKLLQWNFLQLSQLSIRSGAHKLFRQLDFSQFLTAISRKLWRHLATKMITVWCIWKSNPFWKNAENLVEIGLQTATQCLFELCAPRTLSASVSERDQKTKQN